MRTSPPVAPAGPAPGKNRREVPHRTVHPRPLATRRAPPCPVPAPNRGPGKENGHKAPEVAAGEAGDETATAPIRIGYRPDAPHRHPGTAKARLERGPRGPAATAPGCSPRRSAPASRSGPKLEGRPLTLAHEIKKPARAGPAGDPQPWHEMKTPWPRNARRADGRCPPPAFKTEGVQLELLTGPLTGILRPRNGMGLHASSPCLRPSPAPNSTATTTPREKTLEGPAGPAAAPRQTTAGRPQGSLDADDVLLSPHAPLRGQGAPPMPDHRQEN